MCELATPNFVRNQQFRIHLEQAGLKHHLMLYSFYAWSHQFGTYFSSFQYTALLFVGVLCFQFITLINIQLTASLAGLVICVNWWYYNHMCQHSGTLQYWKDNSMGTSFLPCFSFFSVNFIFQVHFSLLSLVFNYFS